MCLIIFRKIDSKPITDDILSVAQKANDDGIGIMYANRFGNPVILKTFSSLQALHYIRTLEKYNIAFGVHFRFATHGDVSKSNCHPFLISGQKWLMHNGVLPNAHNLSLGGLITDTEGFIDNYMTFNPYTKQQIEKLISTNKFLELTQQGFVVYNEKLWTEHDGSLYSNDYSLPYDNDYYYGFYKSKPVRYYNDDDVQDYDLHNYSSFDYDKLESDELSDRMDSILMKNYGYIKAELNALDNIDKMDLIECLINDINELNLQG